VLTFEELTHFDDGRPPQVLGAANSSTHRRDAYLSAQLRRSGLVFLEPATSNGVLDERTMKDGETAALDDGGPMGGDGLANMYLTEIQSDTRVEPSEPAPKVVRSGEPNHQPHSRYPKHFLASCAQARNGT
jgi:hypothetical protein